MTDDDIARIERACTHLCIAYARAVDFRDYDAFVALFTRDATLDVGQALQGAGAIRESLRHRPDELRSRHVVSNVFIEVLDAERARGISYFTLYRHHGEESVRFGPVPLQGPAAVGHYEDRFERTADGWRFSARRAHVAFRNMAQ